VAGVRVSPPVMTAQRTGGLPLAGGGQEKVPAGKQMAE